MAITTPTSSQLRSTAKKQGVFRALRALLAAPLLLAAITFEVWAIAHNPDILGETLRAGLTFILVPVVLAVLALSSLGDVVGAIRNERPLVLAGQVIEREALFPITNHFLLAGLAFRLYEGRKIKLDVSRSALICPDGTLDAGKAGGTRAVSVPRRLYNHANTGDNLILLCTPAGRACKVLPQWPTPGSAEPPLPSPVDNTSID